MGSPLNEVMLKGHVVFYFRCEVIGRRGVFSDVVRGLLALHISPGGLFARVKLKYNLRKCRPTTQRIRKDLAHRGFCNARNDTGENQTDDKSPYYTILTSIQTTRLPLRAFSKMVDILISPPGVSFRIDFTPCSAGGSVSGRVLISCETQRIIYIAFPNIGSCIQEPRCACPIAKRQVLASFARNRARNFGLR